MTILLKILGYSWLVLSAAAYLDRVRVHLDAGRTPRGCFYFLGGGAFSSIGLGVIVLPGVALIALGIWMDRPRRAR